MSVEIGDIEVARQFLADLLEDKPSDTYITIATFCPNEFAHEPDIEAASQAANRLIQAGRDVYYGLGLQSRHLKSTEKGGKEDIVAIRGLGLDVDVFDPVAHKATNLPSTPEDARKIIEFFPFLPTYLIWSGHGWQAIWLLKEPLIFASAEERNQAQTLSTRFQRFFQAEARRRWGWHVDSIGNLDRVLRLPGSINWKNPEKPMLVGIVEQTSTRLDPSEIAEALDDLGVPVVEAEAHHSHEPKDFPPADAERIERQCAFMTHCRDNAGSLAEPAWYTQLSILGLCDNGERLAHERSKPYPDYTPQETDQKLKHAREAAGPRTCQNIRHEQGGESFCSQCPHWGKITSPIQLGQPDRQVEAKQKVQALLARAREINDPGCAFEAVQYFPILSDADRARYRAQFKDALKSKLNLNQFDHAIAAAEKQAASDEESLTVRLAKAIQRNHFFAQDNGGRLYCYQEGRYVPDGEKVVKRLVKKTLEEWGENKKWSSYRANEVVQYILADPPELWGHPPENEINLRNGILNIETKTLRPHTPEWLSTVQYPLAFDPSARCPAWEQFIGEVFPQDAEELAYEIVADLLTTDRSEQKALLAYGAGGNGKGVWLAGLTAFVGPENVSNLSLNDIENNRFATAELVGKVANICSDLPSLHLTNSSTFKAITGCDCISAEYKHGRRFSFQPCARLIFSANHLPRSNDASAAFFQRWIVIPFFKTFRDTGAAIPRRELDARLADPRELSGLLNKALAVLPRLRKQGFTISKSLTEATEELREVTDPLALWLDRATIEKPEAYIAKKDLLKAYNRSCDEAGRPLATAKAFGIALKKLRPAVTEAQRTVRGQSGVWVWKGIALETPDTDFSHDRSSSSKRGQKSLESRHSRHFPNCSGKVKDQTLEGKGVGRKQIDNSKGNGVNHVIGVSDNEPSEPQQSPDEEEF